MIKIENVVTPSPEQWMATILGARNAMNSWARSDSRIEYENVRDHAGEIIIGPNDYDLLMRLRNAGKDHRKYMRMLPVFMNITAPLYWWKEFDTYKIGTTANSCSTMHKIHAKEFVLEDFSHEKLSEARNNNLWANWGNNEDGSYRFSNLDLLKLLIVVLNNNRERYLETKDKRDWDQMIQLLPTSYNQMRTVELNYEVLANIYPARKAHKLTEWHELCDVIERLPYSEFITGKVSEDGAVCN